MVRQCEEGKWDEYWNNLLIKPCFPRDPVKQGRWFSHSPLTSVHTRLKGCVRHAWRARSHSQIRGHSRKAIPRLYQSHNLSIF